MTISMIEGETSHKAERMEVKSSECLVCLDVAVTPHNKLVFHSSSIGKEEWYFDSGCSKHMTENKCFLTDLRPSS